MHSNGRIVHPSIASRSSLDDASSARARASFRRMRCSPRARRFARTPERRRAKAEECDDVFAFVRAAPSSLPRRRRRPRVGFKTTSGQMRSVSPWTARTGERGGASHADGRGRRGVRADAERGEAMTPTRSRRRRRRRALRRRDDVRRRGARIWTPGMGGFDFRAAGDALCSVVARAGGEAGARARAGAATPVGRNVSRLRSRYRGDRRCFHLRRAKLWRNSGVDVGVVLAGRRSNRSLGSSWGSDARRTTAAAAARCRG